MAYQKPLIVKSNTIQSATNTNILNHGDFPTWSTNSLAWTQTRQAISMRLNTNTLSSQQTYTTFTSSSVTADGGKWFGGVLAPSGIIYGIPHWSTTILKIDPTTDTCVTFGNLEGSAAWCGGVLAPNGCIYGIPYDSTTVLKIDPTTDAITTFGSLAGTAAKWWGGVVAANGMIYGIPWFSGGGGTVLKIDPTTDTTTTFAGGYGGWLGGVLAPNGCIYGIPYRTTVLKIDPSADTATTVGSVGTGENNWCGGALGLNGMIYCYSTGWSYCMKIDPTTDTAALVAGNIGGLRNGCVLAPTGAIWSIPGDATTIGKLDPTTDGVGNVYTGLSATTSKWQGGVMAMNGVIYGIPFSSNTILKIGTPCIDIPADFPLSRHFNKY
jgi:streptogramin lyase